MADIEQQRPVLVVDFGAQYAQLIARRVREAKVYSEVIPHTTTVEEIVAKNPLAVVLSGGPSSVYADGAPKLDPALFDHDIPVFGICYGFQAMAGALGGTVAETGTREYGRTDIAVSGGLLHDGLPATQPVWMSHGDAVTEAPSGFEVTATSDGAPVAAFEDRARKLAGVQYHPEVLHSPHGQQVLSRFLHEIAGIPAAWTASNIADALIEQVREQVGDGHAICGLSGGVDSTALYPPKRFLGAARNIENGGSLTIIATAMVETGSTGDTVIFEEFKGTGNAELKLDRKIAERRVFPAVDVNPSGTRKDELLLNPDEAAVLHKLRRVLSGLDSHQAIDLLIDRLRKSKNNLEFLMQVSKTAPGALDE